MNAQRSASSANQPKTFSTIVLVFLTISVSLATFMEVLDSTIVNVSIPHIAGSLGASLSEGTKVISIYGLASAVIIPLTGWLSKYFGMGRVFIVAVILFTLMSFLCGLASSMPELIFFRFLQGFFSGPMVPLSQAILLSAYPPEKRGLGLAFFVMTVVIAPIFGPILGGVLTDNLGWRWIFYINIPVGVAVTIIMIFLLKNRKAKTERAPIDYMGIIFLFIGVGSLQLMLDDGNNHGWFGSNYILLLALIAFVGIVLFLIWELTEKNPAVELTLLKDRNYLVSIICLFLGIFCFFGSVVVFPLWLQTVKGYNATWSGLITAPVGIIPLFLSPILGLMLPKLNVRLVISFGFLVFSITMFWHGTFTEETPFSAMLLPRILQGIGLSCFFLPLNQIALSNMSPKQLASATGLYNFVRAISGSVATAVIIFTWQNNSTKHHAILTESITSSSQPTQEYLSTLQSLGMSSQSAYAQINTVITNQGTTMSTNDIFHIMGVLFLLLIIVVWFTKPPFNRASNPLKD